MNKTDNNFGLNDLHTLCPLSLFLSLPLSLYPPSLSNSLIIPKK